MINASVFVVAKHDGSTNKCPLLLVRLLDKAKSGLMIKTPLDYLDLKLSQTSC